MKDNFEDEVEDEVQNNSEGSPQEKKKQLKGFALNPHLINFKGRPKGSRNKSTLIKAQLRMDSDTEFAAELLGAIMRNDKGFLEISDDVPITMRIAAAKEVLNKSIANEKDKEPANPAAKEDEDGDNLPLFSPVPVASTKAS